MPSLFSPLLRLRWKRRARSLLALLLLFGMIWTVWIWSPPPTVALPLVHVIDGDSLTLRRDAGPLVIRLIGLDAVEYRQDCARADGTRWPCGHDARASLERIAGRNPLHCELAAKDRYGRTLATCRTAAYPGGVDLAAEMIREGWAVASDEAYAALEVEAQRKLRGIWQGRFVRPADWRAAHGRPASAMTPPEA